MGIPTVPVEARIFTSLAHMSAAMLGMPNHRIVIVPHPISRVPAQKCRDFVLDNDPETGKPVIDEIIDGLTKPLSDEDKHASSIERPQPRYLPADSEINLQQYFVDNKMTDYLPIILPTRARVAEMCKGTSHKPDEFVGEMRSGYEAGSFNVEKVAANAVMAGARPEYMPVILAMAASGVPAIATSTQSFSRMIVINGPIRKEIGMNCGTGALSPFNQANSVLGRVATLMSLNLGAGAVPNLTYWGSQGNNLNYNHCLFAENEEALPSGWKPYHVQRGFKPEESAITFFHGYGNWHWKNTYENTKHKSALHMANWVLPSSGYRSGYSLILDPIVAEDFIREGFPTKEAVSKYIFDNTLLPLEEYWQYHLVESFGLTAGQKGIEPFATWLKQPKDTMIHRYLDQDEISVLVVGGKTNDFWQIGDFRHIGTFSIDEWR